MQPRLGRMRNRATNQLDLGIVMRPCQPSQKRSTVLIVEETLSSEQLDSYLHHLGQHHHRHRCLTSELSAILNADHQALQER